MIIEKPKQMCSRKSPIPVGLLINMPDCSLNRYLFVKYGLELETAAFVLASAPRSNDDESDSLVLVQSGQVKVVEYTHIHYYVLNELELCTMEADHG